MRGTLIPGAQFIRIDRIIPADAGNTWSMLKLACSFRDHPRGCGEHQKTYRDGDFPRGSSPRMRGTLPAVLVGHQIEGIIPADAGNT